MVITKLIMKKPGNYSFTDIDEVVEKFLDSILHPYGLRITQEVVSKAVEMGWIEHRAVDNWDNDTGTFTRMFFSSNLDRLKAFQTSLFAAESYRKVLEILQNDGWTVSIEIEPATNAPMETLGTPRTIWYKPESLEN